MVPGGSGPPRRGRTTMSAAVVPTVRPGPRRGRYAACAAALLTTLLLGANALYPVVVVQDRRLALVAFLVLVLAAAAWAVVTVWRFGVAHRVAVLLLTVPITALTLAVGLLVEVLERAAREPVTG